MGYLHCLYEKLWMARTPPRNEPRQDSPQRQLCVEQDDRPTNRMKEVPKKI